MTSGRIKLIWPSTSFNIKLLFCYKREVIQTLMQKVFFQWLALGFQKLKAMTPLKS